MTVMMMMMMTVSGAACGLYTQPEDDNFTYTRSAEGPDRYR